MAKLTCFRGYSGSGKSTEARKFATETGAVVVNRDSLRQMLFGVPWTGKREDEDRVTTAEKAQVAALLRAGINVASDNTYLASGNLRQMAKLASKVGAEFEVIDIGVDVEECIRRDYRRMENDERYVGESVIRRQAERFPRRNWPKVTIPKPLQIEPVEFIEGLPDAVIFDIDGTIAIKGERSPYDYTRVHEDTLDENIWWINDLIGRSWGVRIIIVSGRDDTCRVATTQWLNDHNVIFDDLLMRHTTRDVDASGNKLPDVLVKYRLFNENIRGRYNIRAVFDDRDQVVRLWRSMGLKCCQVAYGDF